MEAIQNVWTKNDSGWTLISPWLRTRSSIESFLGCQADYDLNCRLDIHCWTVYNNEYMEPMMSLDEFYEECEGARQFLAGVGVLIETLIHVYGLDHAAKISGKMGD